MLNAATTEFAARLEAAGIKTRPATAAYTEEMRGNYRGLSEVVAMPASTEDVATIVKHCAEARVGLIPFGGGTGLVAGQVAPDGPAPLILTLERMDKLRNIFPDENTMIVEAGATLANVQQAAEDANRLFPLTYASKDSARIGGAMSVNSGGLNVLRYGTARELCLGIEAVLPNGDIFHGLKRLRKDNTGYDLRNLMIGAEGTLGVITAVTLKLFPIPVHTATAFVAVPNPDAALTLLTMLREHAGDTVSAFELIPRMSYDFLGETHPDLRLPFAETPNWSVLVELGSGAAIDPEAVFSQVFEQALESGIATDAVLAQSGQQRNDFWAVRETIPEANRRIGAIASHDIALPQANITDFIEAAGRAATALLPVRINAFGHLGDGNLHYNFFPPKGESRDAYRNRAAELTRIVHDLTAKYDGTFSAEHGVGRAKVGELERYGDPAKLGAMRAIKQSLDPLGIMNPGAVLK